MPSLKKNILKLRKSQKSTQTKNAMRKSNKEQKSKKNLKKKSKKKNDWWGDSRTNNN